MAMKRRFLLLLQLLAWCRADKTNQTSHDLSHDTVGLSPDLMCIDNTCHVTPDNVWDIQNMIGSNKIIRFDQKNYFMRETFEDFVLVENVSNLLIVGQNEHSHIQCSNGTQFGFYFRNVTNVTITGLQFSNCGVPIPSDLEPELDLRLDLPCDHVNCSRLFTDENATIVLHDSKNITISNVTIAQSPGFAVVAMNSDRHMREFDLVVDNSSLTECESGALLMYKMTALLMRSTLTNSSIGVASNGARVEVKDSVISNCTISSFESGSLKLRGEIAMKHSSLYIKGGMLSIDGGRVVFTSNGELTSRPALTATNDSTIDIENSSEVSFTGFNLTANTSAVLLVHTGLLMQDNSSLEFVRNFASNQSSVFCILKSRVSIVDQSLLRIHENSARNAWIVLSAFESMWITGSDAIISVTQNRASDSGRIFDVYSSDVRIYQNTTFLLQDNILLRYSRAVGVKNGLVEFLEDSVFMVVNNTAVDRSAILVNMGAIAFLENVQAKFINNNATGQSTVISLYAVLTAGTELSHYRQLIVEEGGSEDEFPLDESPFEDEFPQDESPLEEILLDILFNKSSGNPSFLDGSGKSGPPTDDSLPGSNANTSIPMPGSVPTSDLVPGLGSPGLLDPEPEPVSGTGVPLSPSTFVVEGEYVVVYFHSNTLSDGSAGVLCRMCTIMVQKSGELLLTNNTCRTSSYVLLLAVGNVFARGRGVLDMSHNQVYRDSSIVFSLQGVWIAESNTTISLVGNRARDGFTFLFFTTSVELGGSVFMRDNSLSDFGVFNAINSLVYFHGRLESSGNTAESGVITADNSNVFFTNEAIFSNNSASNGGAISLISSVMHVSQNASVKFTRNHASGLGGAIHIFNPRTTFVCDILTSTATACSIQVMNEFPSDCGLFALSFNQNLAGIAGNAIYGGHTSACIPSSSDTYCRDCPFPNTSQIFQYNGIGDTSDLSAFSSDPTRVCFCDNGTPDCFEVLRNITVHPGESFRLSLAIVGYGLGTVQGSVVARTNARKVRDPQKNSFGSDLQYSQDIGTECADITYSIISEEKRENIILAVDTQSFGRSLEAVEAVVDFQRDGNAQELPPILRSPYDSVYETFFHIPIFVRVELLECPVGFELVNGRCVCHQILLDNDIDMCFIDNGVPIIHRPAPYWIGLPGNRNASILIHPQCPFDYCQLGDINITVGNRDTQCQFDRSGILCGSCSNGLSMVLGNSACKKCSNSFISLLVVFTVAGIALVAILTLLNMTVSVGTINGVILFANIIQANRATFLPAASSDTSVLISILSTFIAWLNLDWGISTCFFEGLTTYVKTWLQFVFPLYILAIVAAIIFASYYSTNFTRLFGKNSVPVLATLVLLSYAKILRILITAFSFTTLTGTQGHYSVVWLADGNVGFFESKHAILFLTCLLVLLVVGIPYTVTLTASPWIQRSKYTTIYNKFKPLFDAYMGPYKDNCRYWTGMLLLARVVLIILFSSIANANTVSGPVLNLLLLTLSTAALLTVTAAVKPYKTRLNNAIEIFYLAILLIFSAANLYASNSDTGTGNRDAIYIVLVGLCFVAFLCTGIGHAWYRIKTARHGTGTQLPHSKRDPNIPSDDVEAGESEPRVTMSTESTVTSFVRERRDSMFRESVLDLSYTTYDD